MILPTIDELFDSVLLDPDRDFNRQVKHYEYGASLRVTVMDFLFNHIRPITEYIAQSLRLYDSTVGFQERSTDDAMGPWPMTWQVIGVEGSGSSVGTL